MAGEWREVFLWDVAEYINGRATRPSELCDDGVAVIKIAELNRGITDQTDRIPAELVEEEHWIQEGDLLFAWSGSVGVYTYRGPKAALNQHIFKVTAKPGFDQGFVRYLLLYQLPVFQRYVEDKKTTMGHVTVRDLQRINVRVPPLPEQRAIAHILGTLDDKIELNRRMSETLEAMARAIFKAWFVDFEPVRAKMEGRWRKGQSLPGLPAHLYDLFPTRLVPSELGEIPEGWGVGALGKLLDLAYGRALKEDNRRAGTIPVYGSNGQVGWHDEALATGPGIIVGRKGNPGIVTWVPTDFFAIDTTFYVVPKDTCRSFYFLFYALANHDLPSLAADSAVPGLNRNFVYSNLQIIPPPDVLDAFDRLVKPLFDRQYQNERESRTLAALRYALLPKLISGELRVKDAERFLKERGL
ncbi:restriction endonuclease subunit S [Thermus tenuipuniceus]|uniref:restriction endonuclease subunit S n=1 Tax=Thermus tenuipuniceus TaxID=2078690 RepID=UPI000CF9FEAC|nr:restriction endonuclease subunit S [Thermus tenuipuniceus]